jgi:hypothetical protein
MCQIRADKISPLASIILVTSAFLQQYLPPYVVAQKQRVDITVADDTRIIAVLD